MHPCRVVPSSLVVLAACLGLGGCVSEDPTREGDAAAETDGEDGQTDGFDEPRVGSPTPAVLSRVCVEVETNWTDAVPATETVGNDFWRINGNRPARGAELTVAGVTYNLDDDGCVRFPTPSSAVYSIQVRSEGNVDGIDITALTDWVDDGPDADSKPDLTGNYVVASSTFFRSGPVFQTYVMPASDINESIAWHAYALMAYAMSRSTMRLGDHGNASGCGGSGVPCCGHEDWVDADDDHDEVAPTHLIFHTMRQGSCCGSTWLDSDEVDANGVRSSGYGNMFTGGNGGGNDSVVALGAGVLSQWSLAHELGHMVVMHRTGKREETNYNAALYGCMGQSYWDGTTWQPSDVDGSGQKAQLTREFSSGSSREGWADFYAAQLFNDVGESDCWMKNAHLMDFDLDGDLDNDYAESWKDGVFSCEGAGLHPALGEPDPSDPLASWVNARDWLDEVWTNVCADPTSAAGIVGRSSQYDWTRYLWDMATDEGIPVEELSDIYVDMCPTNWVAGPGSVPNDEWPERRLERSADFHGHGAAHDRQKNNGVAHL